MGTLKFRLVACILFSTLFLVPFASFGDPALSEQTSNGITYLSGGVGQDERDAMKLMAKDFNLELTFVERPNGTYLADVKVTIQDAHGKSLVSTVSDGPWFYAKLPEGKYRITAVSGETSRVRQANIKAGHTTRLNFSWPG